MPALPVSSYFVPLLLLLGSNVFMTFAWYGHLKYKHAPLLTVILSAGASPSSNTC